MKHAIQLMTAAAAIGAMTAVTTAAAGADDPTWGPPVTVSNADTIPTYKAAVDVDNAGNAIAVWNSLDRYGNEYVYASQRPAGGDWDAVFKVPTDSYTGPNSMALRDDGSVLIAANNVEDGRLLAWKPGATEPIDTNITERYAAIAVSVDPTDGDALAVVYGENGASSFSFATADLPAGVFSRSVQLPSFGSYSAAFAAGHDYVVAYPPDAGGDEHWFRVTRVNGVTGETTQLLNLTKHCPIAGYRISADSQGRAVLAWRCHTPKADAIRAVRISPAGTVGKIRTIATSTLGRGARFSAPFVLFAPDGRVTIAWSKALVEGGRRAILMSTSVPGQAWTRPVPKDREVVAQDIGAMQFSGDSAPTGAAILTYRDAGALTALRRTPGGVFAAPVTLFPSHPDLYFASRPGTIDPTGRAFVMNLVLDSRLAVRTTD